jgi:hypothetical protein
MEPSTLYDSVYRIVWMLESILWGFWGVQSTELMCALNVDGLPTMFLHKHINSTRYNLKKRLTCNKLDPAFATLDPALVIVCLERLESARGKLWWLDDVICLPPCFNKTGIFPHHKLFYVITTKVFIKQTMMATNVQFNKCL